MKQSQRLWNFGNRMRKKDTEKVSEDVKQRELNMKI